MSDHTYKNPLVFTVVHIFEPGLQANCAVFKKEEDAVQAGYLIIQENAKSYGFAADDLIQKHGVNVFDKWHSITSHSERIQIFQNPINVINK